jgi:type VI secretion system protein ImpA
MLNLEKLLAPVTPDRPCGEDLAFSSEIDAIVRARQADDPSLEQGAWVTDLKEADWKFVGKQCALLIESAARTCSWRSGWPRPRPGPAACAAWPTA